MNWVKFKDQTEGLEKYDRLEWFDERSKDYRLLGSSRAPVPPISREWSSPKILNQGQEGSCVGMGLTYLLLCQPINARGLDMAYGKERIYYLAQRLDPWPGGAYPGADPQYSGTAVLAGLKALKQLGWIQGYKFLFSLEEILFSLSYHGPVVFGLRMYEGMKTPDENGFITPTGRQLGGHCMTANLIKVESNYVEFLQSWGKLHGINGKVRMTFENLDKARRNGGEAAIIYT